MIQAVTKREKLQEYVRYSVHVTGHSGSGAEAGTDIICSAASMVFQLYWQCAQEMLVKYKGCSFEGSIDPGDSWGTLTVPVTKKGIWTADCLMYGVRTGFDMLEGTYPENVHHEMK